MNADRLTELGITKLTVGQQYRIVDLDKASKKYWTILTCERVGRELVLRDKTGRTHELNCFGYATISYIERYWKWTKGEYLELYGKRIK